MNYKAYLEGYLHKEAYPMQLNQDVNKPLTDKPRQPDIITQDLNEQEQQEGLLPNIGNNQPPPIPGTPVVKPINKPDIVPRRI